jgi:acyl-CoA reductase-like NAD-dependent aldehyde dehydrogenase
VKVAAVAEIAEASALLVAGKNANVAANATIAIQAAWAQTPLRKRLRLLKDARHRMASQTDAFYAAISDNLARTPADTLVAEVLPLLAACKFLERQARKILATRRLGRRGLPLWLAGIDSEVQRVPYGQILVIGPANYPLFLPGVQALQALAAGNSVVWKPGRGGHGVALVFASALYAAGLPRELLVVTEDSIEMARDALAGRVNGVAPAKVFFTGSAAAGRAVLRQAAETATPCVVELSGCDAVVVLASAPVERVVQAIAFGMRLNGSATCMAPRRLLLVGATRERRDKLIAGLRTAFEEVPGVRLSAAVASELGELLMDAEASGADVSGGSGQAELCEPILVTNATAAMRIAGADVFAPVLAVIEVADSAAAVNVERVCRYGLTVSIFGDEREARALAARFEAGTVLVNDIMVPTADPRVPFGGRRQSGFGATRGAEGLLEMTAAKTIAVRRNKSARHYEATGEEHQVLFEGMIAASHAGSWRERWRGLKRMIAAAVKMGRNARS